MRYFSHLFLTSSAIVALSQPVLGASSKDQAKIAEELCKTKAIQSVTAIAQVNKPAAVIGTVKFDGLGKKSKFGKPTCEFTIDASHDDKTKTYKFVAEFSADNKWCQVMKVELVNIPQ